MSDELRNRVIRAACDEQTFCADECTCAVSASIAAASIATACTDVYTPVYTAAYLGDFCCKDPGDCAGCGSNVYEHGGMS